MTTFKFIAAAALLSALIATPAQAQHMIDEPGLFAFFHPNGDLGIASTPRPAEASAPGNAMAQMRMEVRPHSLRGRRAASVK